MVWFEVFIPPKGGVGNNVTLTVEAPNWIGALRTGLANIGEANESISNVMCDIKEDNSIHVTDVQSKRVFRLREASGPAPTTTSAAHGAAPGPAPAPAPRAPERAPAAASAPAGGPAKTQMLYAMPPLPSNTGEMAKATVAPPTAPAPVAAAHMAAPPAAAKAAPPPAAAKAAPPPAVAQAAPPPAAVHVSPPPPPASTGPTPMGSKVPAVTQPLPPEDIPPAAGKKADKSGAQAAAKEPAKAKTRDKVPSPAPPPRRATGQFQAAPEPQKRDEAKAQATDPRIGRTDVKPAERIDDALADVFDATQDLWMEPTLDAQRIAETLLDLALSKVPAESGSFYLADVNGHALRFAAVRGPKADAIRKMDATVPVGQGLVGFCAQEGICLAIADIQHDQRHFSAFAEAIGYKPRNTLCASAEKEGRLFGALQLINAKDAHGFSAMHMEIARYIGLMAADMLERVAER